MVEPYEALMEGMVMWGCGAGVFGGGTGAVSVKYGS